MATAPWIRPSSPSRGVQEMPMGIAPPLARESIISPPLERIPSRRTRLSGEGASPVGGKKRSTGCPFSSASGCPRIWPAVGFANEIVPSASITISALLILWTTWSLKRSSSPSLRLRNSVFVTFDSANRIWPSVSRRRLRTSKTNSQPPLSTMRARREPSGSPKPCGGSNCIRSQLSTNSGGRIV